MFKHGKKDPKKKGKDEGVDREETSKKPKQAEDVAPTNDAAAEGAPESEEDRKRKEEERRRREDESKRQKEVERVKKEEIRAKKEDDKRKKREASERRKADDERRKLEEEDDESEIQDLESVPSDGNKPDFKEMYQLFPFGNHTEVFAAYDKLQNFARELNTQIATPEIVLLGIQGHGKSSILEGFLGQQITHVGYGATKRPLFLNMINNNKCDRPRCTIKRDMILKGADFDHDVVVSPEELPVELEKRNKIPKYSSEPIFVNYEYKFCCNLTLIDTPGLIKEDTESVSKTDVDSIVYNLVKLPHRLILCVEEAKDWDKLEMFEFIKQVDPEFSRTTFVYTKFYYQLQKFTSTRQVNRFLQGAVPDAKSFFTTMLSGKVRSKFVETDKFQEKIWQAIRRDLRGLEQLQYDRRYEVNIGAIALRQYVLNLTWRKYQDDIPQILKRLRSNKAETEKQLKKVQEQVKSLNAVKLRSIASDYVVNFLQVVERLLAGTSEGNPAVNGQTLDEERTQFGDGDWVDSHNKVIKFDAGEWGIPYWESKLYGGQQFERLLSEFKAVADHLKLPEVTMDDIATAAGINKLNNIPNYAWAASDLAQSKSQEEFVPLIEQTTARAVYILRRLTDIVDKIMDSRKRARWEGGRDGGLGGTVDVHDIDMYPFFTYHVKDLYNKYVERTAKMCREKCLDEFYGTRTIFWEYTEYADRNLPMDRADEHETKKSVDALAKELFQRLRERITKNVLLKLYNFLLVPMQTELWSEIQGKVTTLADSELEQKFEVQATRSKLQEDEKVLQKKIDGYVEQELYFMKAATHFSHPVYIQEKK
eukprot:TRINITY_DN13398_c0_g1_i1.p1 TRINITY_DN13398_c0_g1~~TRINITY_DN13398_c0_g1_i1.p1  ORF type:complete len:820 (+),score=248.00 TRINITY_DN13398_c0_g1_i1:64-2523(+)